MIDHDAKYRDAAGRIDPFRFAANSSALPTAEQMKAAGLGSGQCSEAENDCEQDEGA